MDKYFAIFSNTADYEAYINSGGGVSNANVNFIVTTPADLKYANVPVTGRTTYSVADINKVPLVTETAASSVTIDPYVMYNFGALSIPMTISFNTTAEASGYCAQYLFKFTASSGCSITLPNTVKYNGGSLPTFTTGRTYEFNITDNLCVVGEFYNS